MDARVRRRAGGAGPRYRYAPGTGQANVSTVISDDVAGEKAHQVLAELGTVVLGQEAMLRQMMVALLAGGHVLLEGVPGTAKTLAIRALAMTLELRFGRVQFTPDLMPTDLIGVNVLDELKRDFSFHAGPVFTDLLLA